MAGRAEASPRGSSTSPWARRSARPASTGAIWLLVAGFLRLRLSRGLHSGSLCRPTSPIWALAHRKSPPGRWPWSGLFNIVGSYASGVLGAAATARNICSAACISPAPYRHRRLRPAAAERVDGADAFAAAMGLLWLSTVPLTSGLVAQIFGPRYMATLVRLRLLQPSGRRLSRRLAGRLFLRGDGVLRHGVVDGRGAGHLRRAGALAHRRAPGRTAGAGWLKLYPFGLAYPTPPPGHPKNTIPWVVGTGSGPVRRRARG